MVATGRDMEFLMNYIHNVMKLNLKFIIENNVKVLDSCLKLIEDVEKIGIWITPSNDLTEIEQNEYFEKYLMYPMFLYIVYPNVYLLPTLILLGSVPQAFYSIRTALEAIVIALYADNDENIGRLSLVEKTENKRVIKFKIIRYRNHLRNILAKVIDENYVDEWVEYIIDIYKQTSSWVHPVAWIRPSKNKETIATGQLRIVFSQLFRKGVPPSFNLMMPNAYDEEDLSSLEYLKDIIESFRLAIAVLCFTWSYGKRIAEPERLEDHLMTLYEYYQKYYASKVRG